MAKKHRKADAATVQARINEVLAIRLQGATAAQIQAHSSDSGWGGKPGEGLSASQVRVYIARTDKIIKAEQKKKRSQVLAMHQAQRQELYARAVAGGDIRAALSVLDSQARLQGFFLDQADVKELMKLSIEMKTRLTVLEKESANDQRNRQRSQATEPPSGSGN
jgi:hypothetical protein